MNTPMTDPHDELRGLADKLCDGTAQDTDIQRIQELLTNNQDAQRYYLRYMDMHGRLSGQNPTNAPGGVKRMTLQQIILDFDDGGHERGFSTIPPEPQKALPGADPTLGAWRKVSMVCVGVAVLIMAIFLLKPHTPLHKPIAKLADHARSATVTALASNQKLFVGEELEIGEYRIAGGNATLRFTNGVTINILSDASIKIESPNRISLQSGTFLVDVPPSARQFETQTSSVRIANAGVKFGLTVQKDNPTSVHNFTGKVDVIALNWRPIHYWNFNQVTSDPHVKDLAGDAHGTKTANAKPVKGLVGRRALDFDNTPNAKVQVGSGGAKTLGTGSFAVRQSVSIEVVFTSRWTGNGASTGDELDYDQIFRKQDQGMRIILLSFQNDNHIHTRLPRFEDKGPTLAFGLKKQVPGADYHELEIRLDGKDGRPSLKDITDGNLHHVVATYDSRTGIKAIYLDGKLQAKHAYPPGTQMMVGGPGNVTIGNTPIAPAGAEPFNGILDEVAFYDVAITPSEVATHYKNIMDNRDYFGFDPDIETPLKDRQRTYHLNSGDAYDFDDRSGYLIGEVKFNPKRFNVGDR